MSTDPALTCVQSWWLCTVHLLSVLDGAACAQAYIDATAPEVLAQCTRTSAEEVVLDMEKGLAIYMYLHSQLKDTPTPQFWLRAHHPHAHQPSENCPDVNHRLLLQGV